MWFEVLRDNKESQEKIFELSVSSGQADGTDSLV